MFSTARAISWWDSLQLPLKPFARHVLSASFSFAFVSSMFGASLPTDLVWAAFPVLYWFVLLQTTWKDLRYVANAEPQLMDVFINGEKVSSICNHEYRLVHLSTFWNPYLYYRQALNLLRGAYTVTYRSIHAIAILASFFAGLLFLFAPTEFHQLLLEVLRYPSGSDSGIMGFFLTISSAVAFVYITGAFFFPRHFQMKDVFREAQAEKICKLSNTEYIGQEIYLTTRVGLTHYEYHQVPSGIQE